MVLFHAYPGFIRRYPLPHALETFLSHGYLAVGLFFLLSGFILAYTYDGNIDGHANRVRFWEARFARIYPVYLLSLVMAFAFAGELALGTRAAVVAMVQAWNPFNPDMAGAWNYPAWTLSAEAFFYICFPFRRCRGFRAGVVARCTGSRRRCLSSASWATRHSKDSATGKITPAFSSTTYHSRLCAFLNFWSAS